MQIEQYGNEGCICKVSDLIDFEKSCDYEEYELVNYLYIMDIYIEIRVKY